MAVDLESFPASEIWQRAVRALTGRNVTVYFAYPMANGAAEFSRTPEGARILISPDWLDKDPGRLLFLFLHEAGHALDNDCWNSMVELSFYEPRVFELDQSKYTPGVSRSEGVAERLALKWCVECWSEPSLYYRLEMLAKIYESDPDRRNIILREVMNEQRV